MTLEEFLEDCRRHSMKLSYRNRRLYVECEGPEARHFDYNPWKVAKHYKSEIVALLKWEDEFDRLLQESIQRFEAQWPDACQEPGPNCDQYDEDIAAANVARDRAWLKAALMAREYRVLAWIEAWKKEAEQLS